MRDWFNKVEEEFQFPNLYTMTQSVQTEIHKCTHTYTHRTNDKVILRKSTVQWWWVTCVHSCLQNSLDLLLKQKLWRYWSVAPPSTPDVQFYFLSILTKLTMLDSSEPFLVFNCVQEYDTRTCHSRAQEAWLLINQSMVPTFWDSRNSGIITNKATCLEDYTVTNLSHKMLKKPCPLFSHLQPLPEPQSSH